MFVVADGIEFCNGCNNFVCKLCSGEIIEENSKMQSVSYCLKCYGEQLLVPDNNTLTKHVLRANKAASLAIVGVPLLATNDINNVDDIYEALIVNQQATYIENIVSNIIYPLHPTTYLKDITKICPFEIKEGGCYLQNNILTTQQKIDLTKLLKEFVALPLTINTNKSKYYQIIPNIIRKFVEGCRLGSGFRLIRRAVRHAMDPMASCQCQLFEANNKIGLVIEHQVKASMKTAIYNVTVALTCDDLLACTCT
jgi:hypothetical protein